MEGLKIGKLKLKNRLFLAPMVDVTDLPYRMICRKAGAAMAYTEMINVGAILHTNKKTVGMLQTNKYDEPSGAQITGPTVEEFEKLVASGSLKEFDLIDINCGCPSIRITDNASGSYLLKTPAKIASYIGLLKKAGFTVTAKIRLGFDKKNFIEVAKAVEKAGADAITIHCRMAHDSYKVPADWKYISEVKKAVKIPVIGNGDVTNGKQAAEMLKIADGCMIARAAIGDPLIFERILHYLKTGKEKDVDVKANLKLFLEYLKLAKKYDVVELPRIRSLGGYFLRGFDGAAKARNELMKLRSVEDISEFVQKLL